MRPVDEPAWTRRRTIAQALMEWEPVVRLYESRLWRRSVVVEALLGLSFEREYALVVAASRLSGARRVLDLACGPGIYARRLSHDAPAATIVGMDLSWPMLRYAARKSRASNLANLTLVRGDATNLPFPDSAFDAVNCCGALHLFPDVGRVLREVHRVLRDRGRFTVAAFRRGDGTVARLRARARRRLYGIDAFSRADLASRLRAAGFTGDRCLHAAGVWLIMSAQREAA